MSRAFFFLLLSLFGLLSLFPHKFVIARDDNSHLHRDYHLHTTHSPQFLGLPRPGGLWSRTNMGEGIVICVLDTGVAIGHPSFNDDGMPPPPAKWKGHCEPPVVCNNKLVGARSFIPGSPSPADDDNEGHGTHTASTAAGAPVKDAVLFGTNMGSPVGIAPRAHVAVYKVLSTSSPTGNPIVEAMEAAVQDGCDIISASLGPEPGVSLEKDGLAVGSFAAVIAGIFVSTSAGNDGPDPASLSNEMPWALTVGASTMDRVIQARVKLGNDEELTGQSLYQAKDFGIMMRPLVYAGDNRDHNENASFCGQGAFDGGFDIKGKIVVCERGGDVPRIEKGRFVKSAGGAGMILINNATEGYQTEAEGHVLPVSYVSYADGGKIKSYINSTGNYSTATILFDGVIIGTPRAPVAAAFSSRGPNHVCTGILKPDVVGPGVDIVAASPTQVEPTELFGNLTGPHFRVLSGTSMSCPHLSGIAALVKAAHPDWSPAAIKSAIMTTATVMDNSRGVILDERFLPADVLTVGSGHVDVSKVDDPGLVYDTDPKYYDNFLCSLGYTGDQIEAIARKKVDCSTMANFSQHDLNYPTVAVSLGLVGTNVTVKRVVTNVGISFCSYSVEVEAPAGVSVVVTPINLKFDQLKQTKEFVVTFTRTGGVAGFLQGQLKWVSGKYVVRSPMSIKLV